MSFEIRKAVNTDCSLILEFITDLAEYEKLQHEVTATTEQIGQTLFNKNPAAEVYLGFENEVAAGFALIFHNYSTFLAKPGIWLEDLFVKEEFRGKGYGKRLLAFLANLAIERNCGRLEWSVLNWNKPTIKFYKNLGAIAMQDWTTYRLTKDELKKLARA